MFETIEYLEGERDSLQRELKGRSGEGVEQFRFLWKEYVLCDESELTEDAKQLRQELIEIVKSAKLTKEM